MRAPRRSSFTKKNSYIHPKYHISEVSVTKKFQENSYSTHKSAARESTNIYTIECIYRKDNAQKATTTGVSPKMRWRCTKRAARARTALLIIVPSHPVEFLHPRMREDPFQRPSELELELIQTQMTQKPMLRAEVGVRVRCAKQSKC